MDKEGNEIYLFKVSVPIGGLFNLTLHVARMYRPEVLLVFPSPLGDYLI